MSTNTTGLAPINELNTVSPQRSISVRNNQPPPPQPPSDQPQPPPLPPPVKNIVRTLSHTQPLRRPPPNLPSADLLGRRDDYIEICVPMYEASIKGDWEAAKVILEKHPELVRSSITENYETPLHIAASATSTKKVEEFMENLVKLMKTEDLELQNKNYNTALCLVVAAGSVKMADIMVSKNRGLLTILGSEKMMPLYMAALFGNREMVKYLYDNSHKMSGDFWTPQNRGWVLLKCVEADLFDVALKMLEDRPELANKGSVLEVLARKPDAFGKIKPHIIWRIINSIFAVFNMKVGPAEKESQALLILRVIWKNILKMPKNDIDAIIRGPPDQIKPTNSNPTKPTYSSRILFVAAEMGNIKFIVELIRQYPDLIWKLNDDNQSIFHIAVSHRHESIYNLLYEIGSMKDIITPLKDGNDNNMLHLVGKNAKKKRLQDVSGVALQMQRELLWFKEVQAMIPPSYREKKNKEGLTPHELFTKEHKDLVSKGEEWTRETANQSMVVAALIATIVFAAAFTVPGGYDQTKGIPLLQNKQPFIVFVIADAISLTFSSASILMFLSILTSRYAERDFLGSLPKKLMVGLGTLFLSIMTMMIAFSISFFVLYHNKLKWVPILISVFAVVPVVLFAKLQFPLLADVYRSTYGSRYLFKPRTLMLYYQNPKF